VDNFLKRHLTFHEIPRILAADFFRWDMNGQTDSIKLKRKLQLLVVDDEPHICECLKLILALDGHNVTTANSGRAALEVYRAGRFDVVCTDYSMPGMRGDEFAGAIKTLSPGQPVLMITGLASTIPKPSAVDLLINKPFAPNDLRNAFDLLLENNEENSDMTEASDEIITTDA
jgi:CheY-like chemotaxis protein